MKGTHEPRTQEGGRPRPQELGGDSYIVSKLVGRTWKFGVGGGPGKGQGVSKRKESTLLDSEA